MLMACPHCSQIIEIATLQEHLLDECERKGDFEPCPNCGDAILARDLDAHTRARKCKPLPDASVASRCPLCSKDILPDKRGWVTHLIDEGCLKNPRNAKRSLAAGARRR